jgi:ABC-type nitrate/sulfonate/bicarbonate transport system permease component
VGGRVAGGLDLACGLWGGACRGAICRAEISMMRRFFAQSWGLLLIFAAWQVWVMSAHYNSIVIVSPAAVVRDISLHPVIYLMPALWTLGFALSGLAAGLILGLLLAIAGWRSQILSATISPAALLLSSTPVVCLIPLLARIFGYQSRTEFVTVAIMTFFPGFVFASKGLRTLPPGSDEFFAVLAASRGQRLVWLALPAAVPGMAVALRIGAAYSVMVTMISEYLMQTGGLGNMFALTSQAFETERAWGASLVAMTLSVALYNAAGVVETRVRERYR